MSRHFNTVKTHFDNGVWGLSRVYAAVVKGWITAEEYKMITNQAFEEYALRSLASTG